MLNKKEILKILNSDSNSDHFTETEAMLIYDSLLTFAEIAFTEFNRKELNDAGRKTIREKGDTL